MNQLPQLSFPCTLCNKVFTRSDNLRRHQLIHGREAQYLHVNGHNIAHPLNVGARVLFDGNSWIADPPFNVQMLERLSRNTVQQGYGARVQPQTSNAVPVQEQTTTNDPVYALTQQEPLDLSVAAQVIRQPTAPEGQSIHSSIQNQAIPSTSRQNASNNNQSKHKRPVNQPTAQEGSNIHPQVNQAIPSTSAPNASNNNQSVTSLHNRKTKCSICSIDILKSNLARHMKNKHCGWKGAFCEDTGLVANPENSHKPKKCEKCQKSFLLKAEFDHHKNICNASSSDSSDSSQQSNGGAASNAPDQADDNSNNRDDNHQQSQQQSDRNVVQEPLSQEVVQSDSEINVANSQANSDNNNAPQEYCRWCNEHFSSWQYHLVSERHKDNVKIPHTDNVYLIENAFGNRIVTYRITNPNPSNMQYHTFLESSVVKDNLVDLLQSYRQQHTTIKYQLALFGRYSKEAEVDGETTTSDKKVHFTTKMTDFMQTDNLEDQLADLCNDLLTKSEEYEGQGSGWSLNEVCFLEVYICKNVPLRGGAYVKLPLWVESKRACLNPKNSGEECFKWAIRAGLKHTELIEQFGIIARQNDDTIGRRIRKQTTEMTSAVANSIDDKYNLNWDELQFPMKVENIRIFEENNPRFSVNVYGLDPFDDEVIVGPLHRSATKKDHHFNLLFFENDNQQHYCLITNLSALVSSQMRQHGRRKEICEGCLLTFSSVAALEEHEQQDCLKIVTNVPPNGTTLKFEDHFKQIRQEIIVVADFESVLQPCYNNVAADIINSSSDIIGTLLNQVPHEQLEEEISNLETSNNNNGTNDNDVGKLHKHIPSSYSYIIKCFNDPSKNVFKSFRAQNGENAAEHFVKSLIDDVVPMYEDMVLNKFEKMHWTEIEKDLFEKQTHCRICKKEIIKGVDKKVRDHDHITGEFRGAAHDNCNKKFYPRNEVPILFHNLEKYDAHLFIEELAKIDTGRNMEIIPHTDENYISFTKTVPLTRASNHDNATSKEVFLKLRFKDSLKFLAGSLEKHAANLKKEDFNNVDTYLLPRYGPEITEMLKKKGVFPYEYITSFEKYNEPCLPPRKMFKSSLNNGETVSAEDYNYAHHIFNKTGCRNIGEYNDLYLETDVLILADVLENFITNAINAYGLDPTHYFTLPGFSMDAMLKYTEAEIELLSDLTMINFINSGIRGGLCQCSKRHIKANNKYINNADDVEDPSFITYMDVNNLYGVAMSKCLPYNNFCWLEKEEVENLEAIIKSGRTHPHDHPDGYILEVDLDYPEELHDYHNDLPFCPNQRKYGSSKKLCATLEPKKNYVIHYMNLQQALSHGLQLKKIHRVLRFTQKPWLAPYINFNNEMRTKATTEAQKDLFKLMNNSIFGKTIQNVLKYRNIYLCEKWETIGNRKGANSLLATGYMKRYKIFNDSLVAVELARKSLTFDKPIIIGFSVLELSKHHMYSFHYDVMKKKYPEPGQLQLAYMDTDSFIYSIKTDDFYEDLKPLINGQFAPGDIRLIDTSNYSPNNTYGIPLVNKKVLGAMKDETAGKPIKEFVGLRAKSYVYDVQGQGVSRRAKGVKRKVAEELGMSEYQKCLEEPDFRFTKKMVVFKSIHHQIYTERIQKCALNGADDKRFIRYDKVSTYAWGHKCIEKEQIEHANTQDLEQNLFGTVIDFDSDNSLS